MEEVCLEVSCCSQKKGFINGFKYGVTADKHNFSVLFIPLNKKTLINQGLFQAADGNRTRDLRTTNATLYRLSHSSISVRPLTRTLYILSQAYSFVNNNFLIIQPSL